MLQFALEISSSVGSFRYSGGSYPWIRDRQELFRDISRYCVDDYCSGGKFSVWRKHNGMVYLGADSFIKGLTTIGVAFPLVINATVEWGSEREFISGDGCCSQDLSAGMAVQRDCIFGRPLMICQYNSNSLSISPSSSVLSSQNMSHASGMQLLSRGQ